MNKPYEKTLDTAKRRMGELRGERRVAMETLVDELEAEEAASDAGWRKRRALHLKTCIGFLIALWLPEEQ